MNKNLLHLFFLFLPSLTMASYSNLEIYNDLDSYLKQKQEDHNFRTYSNIINNSFKEILLNEYDFQISYLKNKNYYSNESALIFYTKEMIFKEEKISYFALQTNRDKINFYKIRNYPKLAPFNEMEYYLYPPHNLHLNLINLSNFNSDEQKNLNKDELEEIIRRTIRSGKLQFRSYNKYKISSFKEEYFNNFIKMLEELSLKYSFKYRIRLKEYKNNIGISFFIELPYHFENYFKNIATSSNIRFNISNIDDHIKIDGLYISKGSVISNKIINKHFKDLNINDLKNKVVYDFGAGCECFRKRYSSIPSCLVNQLNQEDVIAYGIDICYKKTFDLLDIDFSQTGEFINLYKSIQQSVTVDTYEFKESINRLALEERKADFIFSIRLLCCLDSVTANTSTTPYNNILYSKDIDSIDTFSKDNLKQTLLNALSVLKEDGEIRFYWNSHNHRIFRKTDLSHEFISKNYLTSSRLYSDPYSAYITEFITLIKEIEKLHNIVYVFSYSFGDFFLFIKKTSK